MGSNTDSSTSAIITTVAYRTGRPESLVIEAYQCAASFIVFAKSAAILRRLRVNAFWAAASRHGVRAPATTWSAHEVLEGRRRIRATDRCDLAYAQHDRYRMCQRTVSAWSLDREGVQQHAFSILATTGAVVCRSELPYAKLIVLETAAVQQWCTNWKSSKRG